MTGLSTLIQFSSFSSLCVCSHSSCYGLINPSEYTCTLTNRAIEGGLIISLSAAELRTWALWRREKRVAMGLASIFISLLPLAIVYANKISGNSDITIVFACLLGTETIAFVLTLAKLPWRSVPLTGHLIAVVYRDVIADIESKDLADNTPVISLVNIVTILRAPNTVSKCISDLQYLAHTILVSRVVLHLRKAGSTRDVVHITGTGPGDIEFAVNFLKYVLANSNLRETPATYSSSYSANGMISTDSSGAR
ncbi:uncharacterized protein STEHIDRAFT_111834 [Stereum hirsutum FP-91666 SS1]|uniref:uncharacterized protein n=1 Tax=Stereum hirsutum (strain FP-91666) TaxID=721885 RepID=UPI000444A4AF|nr:uncharacterized protein STEHIDRAFT_111834 [Stereum hirsutum FP-91666 SS1]EIM85206.1 hypothetical protein STEHIDRAFT_111834 [Stereum hirsutum FP-91666 SS1]